MILLEILTTWNLLFKRSCESFNNDQVISVLFALIWDIIIALKNLSTTFKDNKDQSTKKI